MNITNSSSGYGIIAIILHWVMAIAIIGLYWLGDYMEDLDYYNPWYTTAPYWHKAVGMLAFFLLLFRIAWMLTNRKPSPLASYHAWEILAAKITHYGFYFLLVMVSISGYFITTAKGAPIDVLGWFEIPAITTLSINTAELMGGLHELSAQGLLILFLLHVGATIKHHFFDKDTTLKRILKPV